MGVIITAGTIITMDPARTRAEAVAVSDGRIVAVGTAADCQQALPGARVHDTGAAALLPGFVEPHSHPVLSGMATMPPAYWIAPWFAPTWDDVVAAFRKAIDETPADQPLAFFGFDGLLQQHADPTASELDAIFGNRMVMVFGNSGHTSYVTTAVLEHLGWVKNPPEDPVGGFFGRNADGSLNGVATEIPAAMAQAAPVLEAIAKGPHPLQGAVEYYVLLSSAGITSTSEHTYKTELKPAYEALASLPNSPLRISLYHMSTEADCGDPFTSAAPDDMLRKQGIKLWADGSPWVGNVAMSSPYLDTEVTRAAGISPGIPGEKMMNYTRDQLDALLEAHVGGEVAARPAHNELEVADANLEAFTTEFTAGMVVLIDDEQLEFTAFDEITRLATVKRGVADTIPAAHTADTTIWLIDDELGGDGQEYEDGETVYAKALTRTTTDVLDESAATELSLEVDQRLFRPYPPGNVQVDGETIYGLTGEYGEPALTWAHRNRLTQGDVPVGHTEGSVVSEAGVTYNVRVYAKDGETLLRETDVGAVDTWTYDSAMQAEDGDPTSVWIELESMRDGIASFTHYRFNIVLKGGWGYGWGLNWGGAG